MLLGLLCFQICITHIEFFNPKNVLKKHDSAYQVQKPWNEARIYDYVWVMSPISLDYFFHELSIIDLITWAFLKYFTKLSKVSFVLE